MAGFTKRYHISPNPVGTEVNTAIISAEACDAGWMIADNTVRVLLYNVTSLKKREKGVEN